MLVKHYPMRSDLREQKDSYLLEIDLPGCKKEDVKTYLENGYCYVEADFNNDNDDNKRKYLRRERVYGKYRRSFFVGNFVDETNIKAQLKHGLLKIRIPKIISDSKIAIE